ncbi:MAG: 2'-5' RNA ligase family protein [Culicoidibacterales bacterium]
MRIFVGYALSQESKKMVKETQLKLEGIHCTKLVAEKNFHATILYNGELTPLQIQQYITALQAGEWEKIEFLTPKRVTNFIKKRQVITVLELENTDKFKANRNRAIAIAKKLAIPYVEEGEFQPHITLSRQKKTVIAKEFQNFQKLTTIGLMIFTSSTGVNGIKYEVIAKL